MPRTVATPSRPYTTPCDNPQQPCPECGGLECLCRPRFFAGQLLTDEDLNLLNHYILAKNKLHNRYLHGWGVVCGLEVTCDPCSGVQVQPGYALSPCGEDIIVCNRQSVDVCSLINACRKPKNTCEPVDAVTGYNNCGDTTEQWVLAIRYLEKPTRGVTPLRGASGSSCCSKCSCGGSSSCGCGGSAQSSSAAGGCGCGGSAQASSSSASTKTSKTPPQCEPTAICESYRFEVCKLQNSVSTGAIPPGPLIERLQCCIKLFTGVIPPFPPNPSQQDLQNFCCTLKENLAELLAAHPGHACQLSAQLALLCQNAVYNSIAEILIAALPILVQVLEDCLCSALLPPCPAPVDDDRIFLATITIRRRDCAIIEICNWDQRKFAVGFPTLAYWLSPLHVGATLKQLIAKLCCALPPTNRKFSGVNQDQALKFQNTQYPATEAQRTAALSQVIAQSFNTSQAVDMNTLALADFGATDDKQQPLLSDAQMQMPMEALLMSQIGQPLLQGAATVTGVNRLFAGIVPGATAPDTSGVQEMRAQLASMQKTIDEHTQTIAALNAKLGQQ